MDVSVLLGGIRQNSCWAMSAGLDLRVSVYMLWWIGNKKPETASSRTAG